MSKPDWPSIKAEYVETSATLADLQAKWGVHRGTLSARATRQRWHEEKQQFAAKVEQARREAALAKRAAEQEQFEDKIITVAKGQLVIIARQMADANVDPSKTVKLVQALEKVQRIGKAAFGA